MGAYAVQLAKYAAIRAVATARPADREYVLGLGAESVIDFTSRKFEDAVHDVDAVIDTVGGDTRKRSVAVLRKGGALVSAVSPITAEHGIRAGMSAVFFMVSVTQARLDRLPALFESGALKADVGSVLPLEEARATDLMLAGKQH